MRLVYSEPALDDLIRLREFIEEHDPAAARRIAVDLLSRIEKLCEFPDMGRAVAQAPVVDSARDFIVGNYIVRYATHLELLVILRIWHHYENRPSSG